MKKEIITTIIIIICIIAIEIITQKYTDKGLDEVGIRLSELKDQALSKEISNDELIKRTEAIDEFWKEKDNIFSFYLEHEELEKISTQIKTIKADFESDLEEEVIPEIEKGIYILEHLKEKQKLLLKNVF